MNAEKHPDKHVRQTPTSKIEALIQYYNAKSLLERQLQECVAQVCTLRYAPEIARSSFNNFLFVQMRTLNNQSGFNSHNIGGHIQKLLIALQVSDQT